MNPLRARAKQRNPKSAHDVRKIDSHHNVPTTSSRKTRDRTACAKQRLDPNQMRREMRAVAIDAVPAGSDAVR